MSNEDGFAIGLVLLYRKPRRLKVNAHPTQNIHGYALPESDKPKKQMLGANEVVIEPLGLLLCQRQHLLGARGKTACSLGVIFSSRTERPLSKTSPKRRK